jgi:hypothetical protein
VRRARHPQSHLRAGRQPHPAEIAFQAAPEKSRGGTINYSDARGGALVPWGDADGSR